MPSDYQAITRDNIRRRGEEFADIGSFLAEKLYGDRSHFIYELLQNAEDALARRRQEEPDGDFPCDVKFRLLRDHLEVSHYGIRFDEDDVRAICDVLRGTKNERFDQIGSFGIGFKSVYAFTESPEIHSGDEHFVIEQFIRPREVPPRELDDPLQTLFYFPFDHPEFGAKEAFGLIQARLRSLGPRSLLFLQHVKDLLWIIEGAGRGLCMRESHPSEKGGSLVQIVAELTGQQDTEEDWLVIHRDVPHPTRKEKLPVKIAYSLTRPRDGQAIQALSRSPLTAYFPTAKETGLGFLIHGPFASTPARDNIQSDSEWNDLLLSELAQLVADSLEVCKSHGFLTADFLSFLPIDDEMFPAGSTFRPIYDAVLKALTERPLVPTADGSHQPAPAVVLGRSQDMRDLLPTEILKELLGIDSGRHAWVHGAVTENRLPKVWQYLRDECDVAVIDGDTFARHISSRFLDAREEEWMVRFYSFLTGQEALWRAKGTYRYPPEGPLRKKAIIRCDDGCHRPPFDEFSRPAVFLPVDSVTDCNVVDRSIYRDEKAADFFRGLGLVAPDLCASVLNNIIPPYTGDHEISDADHARHVETIRDAMRLKDSPLYTEMVNALRDTAWASARNARNWERYYDKPADLFFPSPNLQLFFEGNKDASFLAEKDEEIDWRVLGVHSQPIIKCRGLNERRHEFVTLESWHGWHIRGWDGFDPKTRIEGLEHALSTISMEKAAYIWNELLPPYIRFLHGRYEKATHQNYDNAQTHDEDSDLCKTLRSHVWIPVGENEFRRPQQCTVAEIAGELRRNEDLARVLGVKADPEDVSQEIIVNQETLVTRAGFQPEVAALLVKNREALTPEVILEAIATHDATETGAPEFPEHQVPNPERRTRGVRIRTRRADPKFYDQRKRSVRRSRPQISPKTWLREMYTNRRGVTVCQICCKAMPFKLPATGHYYFDAVQVADNFAKEDHCLYLALCPLCAAKYTVLVKKDDQKLSDFIWDVQQARANELIVPVQLDGITSTVRFVSSHLLDLKTALDECLS